jgi:regulator of replication initiation timing
MPRAPTHTDDEIQSTIERLVEGEPDRRRALDNLTRNAVVDALGPHPESGRRSSPDRIGPFLEAARAAATKDDEADPTAGETQEPSSEGRDALAAIVARAQAGMVPLFEDLAHSVREAMTSSIETERRRGHDLLEIEARRHEEELTTLRDALAQRDSEIAERRRSEKGLEEQVTSLRAERDDLAEALGEAEAARDAALDGKQAAEKRTSEAEAEKTRLEGELALAAERRLMAERDRGAAEKRAVAAEASLERAVSESTARLEDAAAGRRSLEDDRAQLRQELQHVREKLDETRAAATAAQVEAARLSGQLQILHPQVQVQGAADDEPEPANVDLCSTPHAVASTDAPT